MKSSALSLNLIYAALCTDQRITPWHLGICVTLFMLWQEQGCQPEIAASRRRLMELSRIKSIVTYHKCVGELKEFGYIAYRPSYNPFRGSIFTFLISRKKTVDKTKAV